MESSSSEPQEKDSFAYGDMRQPARRKAKPPQIYVTYGGWQEEEVLLA